MRDTLYHAIDHAGTSFNLSGTDPVPVLAANSPRYDCSGCLVCCVPGIVCELLVIAFKPV